MKLQETLAFDDVLIVPKHSDITSRSEIDISSNLGKINLRIPIIASPMDTVTGADMARAISELGGLGIIHRYNTIEEQVALVRASKVNYFTNVGAAVGVSGDYLERAKELVKAGATVLCIDVAHGDHDNVKNALYVLKSSVPDDIHIMAGSVATRDGFDNLALWGADSIRVGVGGGSICSTRIQTGHGIPTLTSVFECAKSVNDIPLIADGGIKSSGDIVKALAAGADFVMLGSLLAGTEESLGEYHQDSLTHTAWKEYRGMASKEAQINWKGTYSSFEGVAHRVPYRGSLEDVLSDLTRNIRSGLSYSGARNIVELRAKATFVKQSHASQVESTTHIITHDR